MESKQTMKYKYVVLFLIIKSCYSFYCARQVRSMTCINYKSNKNEASVIPEISNWKVLPTGSILGIVENHSLIEDGDVITTSAIIDPKACGEGRIVTTTTGSKYKLKMRLIENEVEEPYEEVDKAISTSFNGLNEYELPEISNWEILSSGEVLGRVQNHPMYQDGDIITTSSIQQDVRSIVENSIVFTKSGSKYKLLKPKPNTSFFEKFIQQESKRLQAVTTLLPTINIKAPSATKEMAYNHRVARSSSNTIMPEISNWKLLPTGAIVGIVTNHPIIDDGDIITTSPLTDPSHCQEDIIVSTNTGSQYRLKNPFLLFNTSVFKNEGTKNLTPPSHERLLLSEQTVGDGKYILVNYPKRSTSGKSLIYTAFKADKQGLPTGKRLVVKLTPNENALQREYYNYKHVTSSGFLRGKFATCIDFYPIADTKHFTTQSALVIEGGHKDLKQLLNARWGQGLSGQAMRDVAFAAGQCLHAMHASNMVWTDLKTENFVIMEEEDGNSGLKSVKGIDLESARPIGQNPVDYSPEACPPEFANAFVNGYGAEFILEPSYDMWSLGKTNIQTKSFSSLLGMMLYELSTGTPYFENKSPVTITKILPSEGFQVDVSKVHNDKLRNLIEQLLCIDPDERLDINQYFMHPFFTTTGFGSFSFIR